MCLEKSRRCTALMNDAMTYLMSNNKVVYTIDCTDFCREDFGKIVFLTKEEAEKKLEELNEHT